MRERKEDKKSISIRNIIIIVFIILVLTTGGVIGYIVFSNWLSSADETITKMADDMNKEIFNQVDGFMDVPFHINKVNRGLIEKGIVNIENREEREQFFVDILGSYRGEIVYSFSYGTETGEYHGARRNENNKIEIMRNNAQTNGNSRYYSVTKEGLAGELVVEAGEFDPRTRDWYKTAKETQDLVFSPIYKHFILDDLTVSAASPIYNNDGELQGVLGTHVNLSKINTYLEEIVEDKNGLAIIIEKNSGALIANSFDRDNFTTLEDGSVERFTIDEIDNEIIQQAYENYITTQEGALTIENDKDRLYSNLIEFQKEGVDWLVITAIPESLFMTGIMENMKLTLLLAIIALILSIMVYLKLTNKFLKPIDYLIDTAENFSQGDLSRRTTITRNDEIGRISKSFNKMADTIYVLINTLEKKVTERTVELEETNAALKENKDHLRLILDSAGEGIYGIDIHGNCTFCNTSCLKLLGYKHQDELIGESTHFKVHHSYKDGTPMPKEECKVIQTFMLGEGTPVNDEVFWRADGTSFDVEYFSYPQYKEGEIVGAVVTFMDITKRKKAENEIKYLSYHDSLTGLYNRMFFEEEQRRLDNNRNLPISIIVGDVNGLKLTNDIFGHSAGDALIKKTGEILKKVCREEDIIARMGGDEFSILLPNTRGIEAKKIIARVKEEFSKEQIVAIKASISMGYDTKESPDQDIRRTIKRAEDEMYKEKTLNHKVINFDRVKKIMEILYERSPKEKKHSLRVNELCQRIGRAMELSKSEVRKAKEAGLLHDIGKIILDEEILNKEESLTEKEDKEMQQHPVIGFRVLNLFDDTVDLAEIILSHHENWDGTGYPKGLKGEEIPIIARIIAVAESFEDMTNQLNKDILSKEEALQGIKKQSGEKFDPKIVDIFIELMLEDEPE